MDCETNSATRSHFRCGVAEEETKRVGIAISDFGEDHPKRTGLVNRNGNTAFLSSSRAADLN
jgi:hypothetical protein